MLTLELNGLLKPLSTQAAGMGEGCSFSSSVQGNASPEGLSHLATCVVWLVSMVTLIRISKPLLCWYSSMEQLFSNSTWSCCSCAAGFGKVSVCLP